MTHKSPSLAQIIAASSVGTMIEFYDFFIFASLAPVLATQFYPPSDANVGFFSTLLTLAVGVAVRPIGSLIFGRVGDTVGRKTTFLITLLIMGGSTAAIGMLPGFKTIGYVAPVLLLLLRISQGLALGGEYAGAATYVAEHAPEHRRGFYTGFVQAMPTVGLFCVDGVRSRRESVDRRTGLQHVGLAGTIPRVDRPGRRVVLHAHAARGVADLLGAQAVGANVAVADSRELRNLGSLASGVGRASRDFGRAGGTRVHESGLRSLFSATNAQGAHGHNVCRDGSRIVLRCAGLPRRWRAV
jgi:hypothetical protein